MEKHENILKEFVSVAVKRAFLPFLLKTQGVNLANSSKPVKDGVSDLTQQFLQEPCLSGGRILTSGECGKCLCFLPESSPLSLAISYDLTAFKDDST